MTTLEARQPSLFAVEPETTGQWRLAEVQLLNWGTFQGLHRVPVARRGHLFTGPSGSGKSSLFDAIAAVLTPDRWLRFNVAAQEAGTKDGDRSLMSYVRGAWSREADQDADRVVTVNLRRGPTWSGLLLRYDDGQGQTVSLVRLFHVKGASIDRDALKDAYVLLREPVDLLAFRPWVENGIDARGLKSAWTDVTVSTGNPGQFYARLRRVLGIKSEGSLHLLHKTQSAKNLGTLDQLFRQFMLDRPGTFGHADNAVEQFGELNAAHQHVVELRRQAERLRALTETADAYELAAAARGEVDRVTDLLDSYQARETLRMARADAGGLTARLARAEDGLVKATKEAEVAADEATTALRRQMAAGGGSVEDLKGRITDAQSAWVGVQRRRTAFENELRNAELPVPGTAAELVVLQERVKDETDAPLPAGVAFETMDRYARAKNRISDLETRLTTLRRHSSNIDGRLQEVRDDLAASRGIPRDALPFAGELLDVDPAFVDWSGAIERVLRPLATTLLVRDDHLRDVRRWADARSLGTRLVIEAVPPLVDTPRPVTTDMSLVHRVTAVDGPFRPWLLRHLTEHYDYACVDGPDALDTVARGVTRAGQVKSGARRFVKDDRHAVDDRRHWVLGSDNQPKIALLEAELRVATDAAQAAKREVDEAQEARDVIARRRDLLRRLRDQRWEDINVADAERRVGQLEGQLARLTGSGGELAVAVKAYEEAQAAQRAAETAKADKRAVRDEVKSRLGEVESRSATSNVSCRCFRTSCRRTATCSVTATAQCSTGDR